MLTTKRLAEITALLLLFYNLVIHSLLLFLPFVPVGIAVMKCPLGASVNFLHSSKTAALQDQ